MFCLFSFKMQSIEGFINNENKIIDTSVADHFIKDASQRLKHCLNHYMIEPKIHLESYSMKVTLFLIIFKTFIWYVFSL